MERAARAIIPACVAAWETCRAVASCTAAVVVSFYARDVKCQRVEGEQQRAEIEMGRDWVDEY